MICGEKRPSRRDTWGRIISLFPGSRYRRLRPQWFRDGVFSRRFAHFEKRIYYNSFKDANSYGGQTHIFPVASSFVDIFNGDPVHS